MGKQEAKTEATGTKFRSASKPEATIRYVSATKLAEEGKTGVVAEGRYIGSIKNRFDKEDFKIESISETAPDGSPLLIVVNAGGNLAYRMSSIKVGDLIQVVYEGQSKIKDGKWAGKMSHQFDVLVGD